MSRCCRKCNFNDKWYFRNVWMLCTEWYTHRDWIHTGEVPTMRVLNDEKSKYILFDLITNGERDCHVPNDMKPFT